MKILKFIQLEHAKQMLHLEIDLGQLQQHPEALQPLLDLLPPTCGRKLRWALLSGPTYREWMSLRIRRGIQAARARRQQEAQGLA
jgi:hypothetical protein